MAPNSGIEIRKSARISSRKRLELVVGPIDLVHEQHCFGTRPDGLEQRTFVEESRPVQVFDDAFLVGSRVSYGAQVEELAGVVPFVQRLVRVDSFVALEADDPAVQSLSDGSGHLGLAHADLAFEQ